MDARVVSGRRVCTVNKHSNCGIGANERGRHEEQGNLLAYAHAESR